MSRGCITLPATELLILVQRDNDEKKKKSGKHHYSILLSDNFKEANLQDSEVYCALFGNLSRYPLNLKHKVDSSSCGFSVINMCFYSSLAGNKLKAIWDFGCL